MSSFDAMNADDNYNDETRFTHKIDTRLDDPAYYDNVRTRRILAVIVDYIMIALLHIPFAILIAFVGVITLGLGWLLFFIITPLIAIIYVGSTLGGADQATPGMKMMGIEIAKLDGHNVDFITAIVHGVIFWAGNVLTGGFILLLGLFTDRKRLIQDLLLGTVVLRSDLDRVK